MASVGLSSKVSFSFTDHSNEKTRTRLHFAPLDASGDNSGILATVGGSISLVGTALDAITLLNHGQTTMSTMLDSTVAATPTDQDAEREWIVRWRYKDNVTGKVYRFDTAGPVDAILPGAGTDELDLANLAVAAFKAVFDANCRSEMGNAVTLLGGTKTGKNT